MAAGDDKTTVFALSTPPGRSAVAVVRLTGPRSGDALRVLCGRLPPPRRAQLARLKDPVTQAELDEALVFWFPAPASFTGEDMAELHLHGGRAVIGGVLDALAALPDLSPAEPGDFTRRAFLCGKLDLAQAEGLADLIDAETDAQRRQAMRQQGGALTQQIEQWRRDLIHLMALAEAGIDFSDEDLPDGLAEQIRQGGTELHEALQRHLDLAKRGERVREGYRVALLGEPNAGKSSLLNALARRDVAIVTDEAGTTRDILEVHLDLGGYAITLADMAGIRGDAGRVETIGIARARDWAQAAELRIFLVPPGRVLTAELESLRKDGDLICQSKSDLAGDQGGGSAIRFSAKTGEGLDRLLGAIQVRATDELTATEPILVTRLRHRRALEDCTAAIQRALRDDVLPELQAEDFRLAGRALGRVTGRVDVEDVLDAIFGSFCIGK